MLTEGTLYLLKSRGMLVSRGEWTIRNHTDISKAPHGVRRDSIYGPCPFRIWATLGAINPGEFEMPIYHFWTGLLAYLLSFTPMTLPPWDLRLYELPPLSPVFFLFFFGFHLLSVLLQSFFSLRVCRPCFSLLRWCYPRPSLLPLLASITTSGSGQVAKSIGT